MANIISINGRQWLAGMAWCSFEDAPSKDELKEDASRLKSDWYAVRIGENAIQSGFCKPIDGLNHPGKVFSLAAMLADSKEQPWLGIFRIADGLWWYIAVRDGNAILPDGDIIGGESEIRAAQERHAGYTDWKYVEGEMELLSDLINEIEAKPTPVKSLTSSNLPLVPIIATAAVLSLLAGGGYAWWHQKQVNEEIERVAAMEKMRAAMASNKPIAVAAPSPLLTTPPPDAWLHACGAIISKLPISLYGWTFDLVSCNQTAVNVSWIRQDGATVAKRPEGDLSVEGDKVNQVIQLTNLEQKGTDQSIELVKAQLNMLTWAQSINIPLSLTQNLPPPPLPGAAPKSTVAENVPLPAPHTEVKFDLKVSPFSLRFNSIPGLRLTSLKSTSNGWTLEGVIYGR